MKLSELKNYTVVPRTAPVAPTTTPSKDPLSVASDVGGFLFPGTKQIGESLGTIAAAGGRAVQGDMQGASDILKTQKTVPELAGAYTASAASLAGSAGVGTSGGFLVKALQSAGLGALISGGSSAARGDDAEDIAKSAVGGAAIGGATSAAFSGGEAVLKSFRGLPERLIRSATGQPKNELIKGKDISKYVLENKRVGTADQLIESAQQAIDEADGFINQSLQSAPDQAVPLKDILADISESINAGGGDMDEMSVRSVLESLAPQVKKTLGKESLSLTEANQLRSQLDKILGNRAFINAQLPFNKGILMDVSNSIREQVKGRAPEGVRQAFETYSKEIKLRDLLISKTAGGSRNQIIGLGDLLSGGFGGAVGGVPGAIAGATAKRVAESTIFKTGSAQLVSSLDETLTPVLSQLEPAAQTAVINALVQAFSALETERQ